MAHGGNKSADLKDNFQQGDSYEQYQYFYHHDHLGSSSFITNIEGDVVQHIEYVPYGEVFIEERNNVWNTPYLFNAKEFDEETGLYYYGARYYDSRLSMWYGVDALAEKYPNMGGYVYCVGNPVKFVDPDGEKVKITVVITRIENKSFGSIGTGTITVVDEDKKLEKTAKITSGGKPYGDPIPEGDYTVLHFPNEGFFRLEAMDESYGDDVASFDKDNERSQLRLHWRGRGHTMGCVSVDDDNDWQEINSIIKGTDTEMDNVDTKSKLDMFLSLFGIGEGKEEIINYGTMKVSHKTNRTTNEQ